VSLTAEVRAELAALPLPSGTAGRAELSGLLRFGGVLHRHGGVGHPWTWVSTLQSTAARRADRLVVELFGERCQLRARRIGAPRPMLLVEVELPPALLAPLALDHAIATDGGGLPPWIDDAPARWAYVRGTALAGLRLAQPHRPHCEIEAPSATLADGLAALLRQLGVRAAATPHVRERWRVVSKSRGAIGTLLAGTGATAAYLQWEEERARHAVRRAATRGANADRANARRSVRAATAQLTIVQEVLARFELDDELRTTALARVANPTASLAELAQLLDVSRATVSRRFRRLADAVRAAQATAAPQ
jgi:DNA-binding protein WhiA